MGIYTPYGAVGSEMELGNQGILGGKAIDELELVGMLLDMGIERGDGVFVACHERAHEEWARRLGCGLNLDLNDLGESGVWANNFRCYNDNGHLELCTQPATNPYDAVCMIMAGFRLADQLRRKTEVALGNEACIRLYANNGDGKKNSYGFHENYLVSRKNFHRLVQPQWRGGLADLARLFLITREIVTGAGKVGAEAYPYNIPYQISPRADFFVSGIDSHTVDHRTIINTRDEPWADSEIYARFHVIVGGTNISPLSNYLKFGMTMLFFMMLEDGILERYGNSILVPLRDSVMAFRAVSRDLTLRKGMGFINGKAVTALEVQYEFQRHAARFVSDYALAPVWVQVVEIWKLTLDGFAQDERTWEQNALLRDLDWIRKRMFLCKLIDRRAASGKTIDFLNPQCHALALRYHDLDPEANLFMQLMRRGQTLEIVREEDIVRAGREPLETTRAWFFGMILRLFSKYVIAMTWDRIVFAGVTIMTHSPLIGSIPDVQEIFAGNPSHQEVVRRMELRIGDGKLSGFEIKRYYELAPCSNGR